MLSFPEVQKDAPPQFVDKLLSDTERRNPQTTHKIESPQFLGKLLQEVLSDVALQDSLRPDQNMRFLREADRVLKESLGDTSYKNCIYESLSHMLKDARKP